MRYANEIITDRKNRGWTQRDLAKKLCITQQSIAKYEDQETGGSIPRPKQMKKLLDVFGRDSFTYRKYSCNTLPNAKIADELLQITLKLLTEREELIQELQNELNRKQSY